MELNLINWFLAIFPVLLLLVLLMALSWDPAKAGMVSWLAAMAIAFFCFGADGQILALANSKGMGLSLYVLLIIWTALFLYNVVDQAAAIKVIGAKVSALTEDRALLMLLLAWCFTSLLQGLAGFGVPVAVVAPIMIAAGFPPLLSVTACLVGHTWAVTFGSMGSSYNAIQLVTGIDGQVIGPQMALLFAILILATGLEVAYLGGGRKNLAHSLGPVLSAWLVMAFVMWLMAYLGVAQLGSLAAAGCGCLVIAVWTRLRRKQPATGLPAPVQTEPGAMGFHLAALPYYLVIALTLLEQLGPIKAALGGFAWGLPFPATTTAYGYAVEAVDAYSKIKWFNHPALILLISALLGGLLYIKFAGRSPQIFKKAWQATVKKSIPTSVSICAMVMMALVMGESGMTIMIAEGAAATLSLFYPLIAPFIGILGTIITNSNTNSNIMFGLLQYETGQFIGLNSVLLAAAQSVGGSIGVCIAPATVMMNLANVGLEGQESQVIKTNLKFCLINAALVGLAVFILA